MTLIAVKELPVGPIEASMRAEYAARRARLMNPPIRKQPAKKPETEVVYHVVRARQWQQPVDLNAHVLDWYKAECALLGKKVSELHIILGGYDDEDGKRLYLHDIIREMSRHYGVSLMDIRSDRRTRAIVLPRQKMMWVAKQRTPCSFPEIGRHFGGKDHTTVLHAVKKIDRLIAEGHPSVADLKEWVSQ